MITFWSSAAFGVQIKMDVPNERRNVWESTKYGWNFEISLVLKRIKNAHFTFMRFFHAAIIWYALRFVAKSHWQPLTRTENNNNSPLSSEKIVAKFAIFNALRRAITISSNILAKHHKWHHKINPINIILCFSGQTQRAIRKRLSGSEIWLKPHNSVSLLYITRCTHIRI